MLDRTMTAKSMMIAAGVAAALAFCSCRTGGESTAVLPAGWPHEIAGRKLYAYEYGFVYATRKAAANQVQNLLEAAVADAAEDGAARPIPGLVLVMDRGEKPPIDVVQLFRVAGATDLRNISEEDPVMSEAIAKAREQVEEEGIDPNHVLAFVPLPFSPKLLSALLPGLPEDAPRRVGWCLALPTDECVRAGIEWKTNAAVRGDKPGSVKEFVTRTVVPAVQKRAVAQMRRTEQILMYKLLITAQQNLSAEQKKAKAAAYEKKLNLTEGEER